MSISPSVPINYRQHKLCLKQSLFLHLQTQPWTFRRLPGVFCSATHPSEGDDGAIAYSAYRRFALIRDAE